MRCSEPGHRVAVAIERPRGPGRLAWVVAQATKFTPTTKCIPILGILCAVLLVGNAWSEDKSEPMYFRAKHGYNGGSENMVDLSKLDGFDQVRNLDDIARFARKVPGAIGFTAHPNFEKGTRYARAVISYTSLSPTRESWKLYLYDRAEAEKPPGSAPGAGAELAFEGRIQAAMGEARKLIDSSGADGVNFRSHSADIPLAYAVMRLGGTFAHTGEFGTRFCTGCRNIVKGGSPAKCALGVLKIGHWSCCGSTKEAGHCEYWKMWKAEEDRKINEREKAGKH